MQKFKIRNRDDIFSLKNSLKWGQRAELASRVGWVKVSRQNITRVLDSATRRPPRASRRGSAPPRSPALSCSRRCSERKRQYCG